MIIIKKIIFWIAWLALLAGLAYYLAYPFIADNTDKSLFLPSKTSNGHHQIEENCELCHEPFGALKEQGCLDCHVKQLNQVGDSHAAKIFKDPRNADTLEVINATSCLSCHNEHQQSEYPSGVTIAADFCVLCHQDIAKDRPSHQDMAFDTCSDCHNYHDNTALYEDFLAKHLEEPATIEGGVLPERNFLHFYAKKAKHSLTPLKLSEHDAPVDVDLSLGQDWLASSHAQAGINCQSCHLNKQDIWVNKPDQNYCKSCHKNEVKGFLSGKHGMRLQQNLSPMSRDKARLPMTSQVMEDQTLSCISCHAAHQFKTDTAAVNACLTCHADDHSLAYKNSRHFQLWNDEQQGILPVGSGVSCASCHLPRESKGRKKNKRTRVQHNQNHNLRPNQKMLRQVCMQCHGVGFSLDSLADKALIKNNFSSSATKHLTSLDMVKKRLETQTKENTDE